MIRIFSTGQLNLEKALLLKCRPYLRQVHHVLRAEGHNKAYCEDLLSNIYHHALCQASENMMLYPLNEAIDLALKNLEPAENYSL